MIRWNQTLLQQVAAARDRALAGLPVALVLEGEPGIGKSTLLREISAGSPGFRVLYANARESVAPAPYRVLEQWLGEAVPALIAPWRAAQHLRNALDERPTLLMLDDLHWGDEESIVALVDVATRLEGDRLLVATASRPLAAHTHATWQHWCQQSDRVERVHLTGIDVQEAISLLHERQPALDLTTIRALWEHTGGNPLHLLALAAEYQPGELSRARALPAPSSFTAAVTAVLARLPYDSVMVSRALAVLGDRWNPLPVVAEVARVEELSAPVQQLVDAELVQLRADSARPMVRVAHSLIRASIYQATELPLRRALHTRAAGVLTGQRAALDHRLAAAERFDARLADDLESYADQLHDQRSHRLAAHYLAAASDLTPEPEIRQRRYLDGLFESLLAGERRAVRDDQESIADATDQVRRGLVLGTLAIWERRYPEGIAALEAVESAEGVDPLTGYRIDVILAWGRHMSGAPVERIRVALRNAQQRADQDASLRHLALLCAGQLDARDASVESLLAWESGLPSNPAEVAVDATPALTLRAVMLSTVGQFDAAIADLQELVARMQKGLTAYSSGVYHALLARCQWYRGDWAMARLNMRLALDVSGQHLHPVVAAVAPAIPIGDGDLEAADEMLRTAYELIDPAPWVEAVDLLDVTQVIREHAATAASGEGYARMRGGIEAIRRGQARKNVVWCLHAGLAAVWAREFADAQTCAHVLESASEQSGWSAAGASWLRGLMFEAHGDGRAAIASLRQAVEPASREMPLYAAHMLVDFSRVAHVMGDAPAAQRALSRASGIYAGLGAEAYRHRPESLLSSVPAQRVQPTYELTDRERDVLTLVTAGMSYAQISSTLFITQSTVGFHLGRIYAKSNVNSRHQLTQLFRTDPAAFGLT